MMGAHVAPRGAPPSARALSGTEPILNAKRLIAALLAAALATAASSARCASASASTDADARARRRGRLRRERDRGSRRVARRILGNGAVLDERDLPAEHLLAETQGPVGRRPRARDHPHRALRDRGGGGGRGAGAADRGDRGAVLRAPGGAAGGRLQRADHAGSRARTGSHPSHRVHVPPAISGDEHDARLLAGGSARLLRVREGTHRFPAHRLERAPRARRAARDHARLRIEPLRADVRGAPRAAKTRARPARRLERPRGPGAAPRQRSSRAHVREILARQAAPERSRPRPPESRSGDRRATRARAPRAARVRRAPGERGWLAGR